ncbi:thiamine phosphate synthase [Nibricoccus sp. IMCC34717]|uniref:thiamine phosphate synthase n=1 Tax=Nibricoccus sp. IMCC34717 TaxID=3034021 RepID=UPI00384CEE14
MRWVVISPEAERDDECEVARRLLAAGMSRYHLRKPGWSRDRIANWLRAAPRDLLTRCVLHGHQELIAEFPVLGRHWRDEGREPAELGPGFTSRSCHDTAALNASLGRFSSVFFSPVFSSVSKPGYGANGGLGPLPSLLRARNQRQRSTEVIALGGITPDRVAACSAWGFDGVATLGWVWQATDPLGAFLELLAAVHPAHVS